MTEDRHVATARRWAAIAKDRLRRSGPLLVAAAAAVLVLHLFSGGSALLVAAVLLVLVAVALLVPTRSARLRATGAALSTPAERRAALSAESLAAAIADPLILADDRGSVVMANRAAVSAFGVRPGLSLPLKFRAPEMQALLEAMLSGAGGQQSADHRERLPIERVFRVSAVSAGEGTGLFVLLFKDQSETLRIDRMRADFIANASHELRTPLAAISGFVETLRGPARNDPAARERFLQIMQEQTARMARLIEGLLSLSRLEMKALASGDSKVELVDLIGSVVETLRPLAAESGVELENLFGEAPVAVPGDRDELFQVFQNLVENACKYGRSGGRVRIASIVADGREIGVEVRDFGPGIAAEHIPRITERFYRIDADESRLKKGTGLGLSIVKHIVSRHRGRLAITSELGKGAAFTVYLPAA